MAHTITYGASRRTSQCFVLLRRSLDLGRKSEPTSWNRVHATAVPPTALTRYQGKKISQESRILREITFLDLLEYSKIFGKRETTFWKSAFSNLDQKMLKACYGILLAGIILMVHRALRLQMHPEGQKCPTTAFEPCSHNAESTCPVSETSRRF